MWSSLQKANVLAALWTERHAEFTAPVEEQYYRPPERTVSVRRNWTKELKKREISFGLSLCPCVQNFWAGNWSIKDKQTAEEGCAYRLLFGSPERQSAELSSKGCISSSDIVFGKRERCEICENDGDEFQVLCVCLCLYGDRLLMSRGCRQVVRAGLTAGRCMQCRVAPSMGSYSLIATTHASQKNKNGRNIWEKGCMSHTRPLSQLKTAWSRQGFGLSVRSLWRPSQVSELDRLYKNWAASLVAGDAREASVPWPEQMALALLKVWTPVISLYSMPLGL